MKKKSTNPTKVITGVQTRWSYANVWNPKAMAEGAKPKYSVSLIITKSDTVTIQKIKAAIKAAYEEGQSKLKGNGKSVPPLAAIKTPLRDGDVERPDDEAYQNAYFVNANTFYAFNSNGNKGIACGLNNLQKIADGEPLGGKTRAEDDFADIDDEDDDDDDDFLN